MKVLLYVGCLALVMAALVAGNRALSDGLAIGTSLNMRWVLLAMIVVPPVYFIPSITAAGKQHPQAALIFFTNIVLGWSGIGWVAALAWALSAPGEQKPYMPLIRRVVRPPLAPPPALPAMTAEAAAQKIEELAAMRYRNAITEAEYMQSRNQILEQWQKLAPAAG